MNRGHQMFQHWTSCYLCDQDRLRSLLEWNAIDSLSLCRYLYSYWMENHYQKLPHQIYIGTFHSFQLPTLVSYVSNLLQALWSWFWVVEDKTPEIIKKVVCLTEDLHQTVSLGGFKILRKQWTKAPGPGRKLMHWCPSIVHWSNRVHELMCIKRIPLL